MGKFYLIQSGLFVNKMGTNLIDPDGVVELSYMGYREFECKAIPKAFRRIMYSFEKYVSIKSGIFTPEGNDLIVFCNKKNSDKIIEAILEFIKNPCGLKAYSDLEKVPIATKYNRSYTGRHYDFWWCIDKGDYGDWMAFLSPNLNLFEKAISNDYYNWWLAKSPEKREEEYNMSI